MRRAIDEEARFRSESALALYAQAIAADPFAALPRAHYRRLNYEIYNTFGDTLPEFRTWTAPVQRCLSASRARDWATLHRLMNNGPERECAAYLLTRHSDSPPQLAAQAFQLLEPRAATADLYRLRVASLQRTGDSLGIPRVLEAGIRMVSHPVDSMSLYFSLSAHYRARGQILAAKSFEDAAARMASHDRRPALRYWYLIRQLSTLSGPAADSVYGVTASWVCSRGAHAECVAALGQRGGLASDRGDPKSGARWLGAAATHLVHVRSDYQRAWILIRLGRATAALGDRDSALVVLNRALRFAIASKTPHLIADVHHNIAHVHEAAGRDAAALESVRRFVEVAELLTTNSLRVVSLRDAGVMHWDRGERAAARQYFNRMVQLIDVQRHDYHWAGEYFERIGDFGQARRYYELSRTEVGDTARKTAGLSRALLAVGAVDSAAALARIHDAVELTPEEVLLLPMVEAARGNLPSAVAESGRWARLQEGRGNLRGAATAYLQLADLLGRAGRFAESARAAARGYEHANATGQQSEAARALVLNAVANHRLGRTDSALVTFERAIGLARRAGYAASLSEAYTAYGRVLFAAHRRDSALHAYDSAIAIRRRIRSRFDDDFDRVRFHEQGRDAYRAGMQLVLGTRDLDLIYQWMTRWKEDAAVGQIPTLRELQARLAPEEAVIDYAVLDSSVAVLVISRDRVRLQITPQSRSALIHVVDRLRQPMRLYFGKLDLARAKFDDRAARELYDILLRPVEPDLEAKTRWLIAPDDALNFVPFDALRDRSGAYVIDRVEIAYLTRAHATRATRQPNPSSAITVITTDAPASAAEASHITKVWPSTRTLRFATEAAVFNALRHSDVVHFATHAEANAAEPLSSYVQVAPGEGGDGVLHVSELRRARVAARLVVLSSCETLYGRFFGGSGVMSIARVVLDAGAGSVLATQWPVGAPAADFAATFYARLRAGDELPAAVRTAKLALRRSPATSDPIFWAPFALIQR